MKIIKIWNDSPSEKQLNEICELLKEDGVIIWPTDTLYGLACSALSVKAIERVCRIKGINPAKTDLSIVCCDISQASAYARIDNNCYRIIRENTPGAFTFLLKAASSLPKAFKGRKTVGIRIPDCMTDREIARALDLPVMTTSINFESDDYAVNPSLIAEAYEDLVDLMIEGDDGGTEPSTIVDCTSGEPEIIREGKGVLI